MKSLYQCIEEIIKNNFVGGEYFDSHSVIHELQNKEYHQVYLANFPRNSDVETYHRLIANEIKKCKSLVSEAEITEIKSHTIYGKLSKNHLWKRI